MRRPLLLVLPAAALLATLGAGTAGAQRRGGGRPPPGDSADARPPRDPATINAIDVILERRGDLGLTPDQVGRVTAVRSRRNYAVDSLSARAEALRPPRDPNVWTTMSDSERVAMREQVRARAAALRAQRDVEAGARDEALAVLTPEQRARAAELEESARKSAAAESRFGRTPRGDGGSPGGGGRRPGGP